MELGPSKRYSKPSLTHNDIIAAVQMAGSQFGSIWEIFFYWFLESVLIVKDLGVQFTTSGVLGFETSQFIEQHKIVDVLINEVITMVCIKIDAVLTDCCCHH